MNAQPVTDVRDDLELWLEATLRCEVTWSQVEAWHPQSADWRATGRCPACSTVRSLLVCLGCAHYITARVKLRCEGCGYRSKAADFFTLHRL